MDIENRAKKIMAEHLRLDVSRLLPSASFIELGADTLDFAYIIMDLESEFQIYIPEERANKIDTVGDMLDCIWEGVRAKEA